MRRCKRCGVPLRGVRGRLCDVCADMLRTRKTVVQPLSVQEAHHWSPLGGYTAGRGWKRRDMRNQNG